MIALSPGFVTFFAAGMLLCIYGTWQLAYTKGVEDGLNYARRSIERLDAERAAKAADETAR